MQTYNLPVPLTLLALLSVFIGGANKAADIPVAATEPAANGPFGTDGRHPWNRLFLSFFVRDVEYPDPFRSAKSPELTPGRLGPEVLDPPLGLAQKFVLDDEPYAVCTTALDEFRSKHADSLIADPLKRAVMQHDLWAVFDLLQTRQEDFMRNYGSNPKPDTAVQKERRIVLSGKIAKVMASLALSREQLVGLPDTYAAAVESRQFPRTIVDEKKADYLPADLFDENAPWVELSHESAPFQHTIMVQGRSVFRVFFGAPVAADGAKPFSDWLAKMHRSMEEPVNGDLGDRRDRLSAAVEQIPLGTRLLLLRQMTCIDDKREVVPTRVVESVQLRVYRTPHSRDRLQSQFIEEFEINRSLLFSNRQGGLRPTPVGEPHPFGYTALGRLATDEDGKLLARQLFPENCLACHVQPKGGHHRRDDEPADYEPQLLSVALSTTLSRPSESKVAEQTTRWKRERPEFKRLIELMAASADPAPSTQPATASGNNGLSISAVMAKETFTKYEDVKFKLTLTNVSDKPFMLYDVSWRPAYSISVDEKLRCLCRPNGAWSRVQPGSAAVAPGESQSFDFGLSDRIIYDKAPGEVGSKPLTELPHGKHHLVISRSFAAAPAGDTSPHPHWTGTIESKPVEFEIVADSAK